MVRCNTVVNMVVSGISVCLIVLILTALVMHFTDGEELPSTTRSFTVDHKANTFLLDGKPFRYVSGSFHYFRALPGAWEKRLKTMRAAGLNVIDTYVEWSLHNPHDGVYEWTDIADIEKFIELAQAEGFYVILRPGPYICAERDNGGLPHWLFTKYPNIQLRTSDPDYLREVRIWYNRLMPKMQRFLYGNGGPIIMVQVENEYGVFHACDQDYLNWLRDETKKYVADNALLFTTDIPNERIKCGKIDGVFATTDFGIDRIHEIDNIWQILRSVQPTGPLVNSEFYPGWLTHWQEDNQRRDGQLVADALTKILSYKASVNFYMFFGGTNFGFTAGANDFGFNNYTADITSYDYDAVMDEAGGITKKFELVRDVIASNMGELPQIEGDIGSSKAFAYGKVKLEPIMNILSAEGRATLAKGATVQSVKPKTFEELDQYSGLVLYETALPTFSIDPALLTVNDLRDRAYVYMDQQFIGTLSRQNAIYSLPLSKTGGKTLQILVENQGRINFNVANDTKGILGQVTLQKRDNEQLVLENWSSTSYPLEEPEILTLLGQKNLVKTLENVKFLNQGPMIYYGEFTASSVADSYLNTQGWGKGVAFINGFNLGRYWPLAGPQLTLYVPKEILKRDENFIILIEYQQTNYGQQGSLPFITLDDKPQLDIKF